MIFAVVAKCAHSRRPYSASAMWLGAQLKNWLGGGTIFYRISFVETPFNVHEGAILHEAVDPLPSAHCRLASLAQYAGLDVQAGINLSKFRD